MNNSDKKKLTTKVQLTEQQQKAIEDRSLNRRSLTLQEVIAKEKAKVLLNSLKK